MSARYSEEMKQGILAEIAGMRQFNKVAPVSGTRFDIPAEDRSINVVYYRASSPDAPVILGFHGGGYAFGGNALDDAMWSAVSQALDANVASVEYRKSPEHPFPAPWKMPMPSCSGFRPTAPASAATPLGFW